MKLSDYRKLGPSNLMVSPLGLGTMNFGKQKNWLPDALEEEDAFGLLDTYVRQGGNFIDTANVYAASESEAIIGRWLKKRGNRKDIVLATKCLYSEAGVGADTWKDPTVGLSRKAIRLAIDHSLRRLQTDYVDLYQTHGWDAEAPLEETLETLNGLVKEGKVRYVAMCNLTGWQLSESMRLAEKHGWQKFVSAQMQYNLLTRDIEVSVLPVINIHKMGLVVWGPLAGGVLTGKYRKGEKAPEGSRFSGTHPFLAGRMQTLDDKVFDRVAVLSESASAKGVMPLQVAIAWLLYQPAVTSVLMGPKKLSHLNGYVDALAVDLGKEEMDKLDKATEVAAQLYPYSRGRTQTMLRGPQYQAR